jgi:hypothetical protein
MRIERSPLNRLQKRNGTTGADIDPKDMKRGLHPGGLKNMQAISH